MGQHPAQPSIADVLSELSLAAPGPRCAELEARLIDALTELSDDADVDAELARGAFEGLEPDALGLATRAISERSRLSVAALEAALAVAEEGRGLLDAPAFLTADPVRAELAQQSASLALEARHSLHLFAALIRACPELAIGEIADARLDAIDVRLRALIEGLGALDVERARRAADLAPERARIAWWWSAPARERASDPLDPALIAWVRRHVGRDAVLRLERDDARALLSTPRGRWLADELADHLDVAAAALADEELGASIGSDAAVTHERPIEARDIELGLAAAEPLRLAAQGRDVLARHVTESAELILGLGVVSFGIARVASPKPPASWLIIPDDAVTELRVSHLGAPLTKQSWGAGGLLFEAPSAARPALDLEIDRAGEDGRTDRLRLTLRARPVVRPAGRLEHVLGALGLDELDAARAALDALSAELRDDGGRRALDGLARMVQARGR